MELPAAPLERGAILVQPGLQADATVVPRSSAESQASALLGCSYVERWPFQYQLDCVRGPSGRVYRFDIWVDEEGALAGRPANVCASLAAHPFNEARGRLVRGPALLVPLGGETYALADWSQICAGVWSLECGCEEDCAQSPGKCPRVSLVEANLAGPLAAAVRV